MEWLGSARTTSRAPAAAAGGETLRHLLTQFEAGRDITRTRRCGASCSALSFVARIGCYDQKVLRDVAAELMALSRRALAWM